MSGCHVPETKCNDKGCIACYGGAWLGVYPPTCNSKRQSHREVISRLHCPHGICVYAEQACPICVPTSASWYKEFQQRMDKLEKQISNWEEEFYFLKDKLRSPDKKPHKCPICDLTGAIQLESDEDLARFDIKDVMRTTDNRLFVWCKACKGEGIVWG